MKGTAGEKILLLAPGNYGENFLRENMGVPLGEAVLCSNFVGDAVAMLVKEQIRQVLFVGHIGKMCIRDRDGECGASTSRKAGWI